MTRNLAHSPKKKKTNITINNRQEKQPATKLDTSHVPSTQCQSSSGGIAATSRKNIFRRAFSMRFPASNIEAFVQRNSEMEKKMEEKGFFPLSFSLSRSGYCCWTMTRRPCVLPWGCLFQLTIVKSLSFNDKMTDVRQWTLLPEECVHLPFLTDGEILFLFSTHSLFPLLFNS